MEKLRNEIKAMIDNIHDEYILYKVIRFIRNITK